MKIRHVPEQIADVILIPVLFTLMFTYLFGGALAGSTGEYLQFLLPGTLVMAVTTITIYTGVTINTDVATGTFDRFRSLPIPAAAPFIGALIGDLGRYLLASAIVLGLGLVMGYRPEGGLLGLAVSVFPVLMFSSALSWAWLALGLLLRTPGSVQTVSFVVLFPLTFASNTFVDPATMPGPVRTFVDLKSGEPRRLVDARVNGRFALGCGIRLGAREFRHPGGGLRPDHGVPVSAPQLVRPHPRDREPIGPARPHVLAAPNWMSGIARGASGPQRRS